MAGDRKADAIRQARDECSSLTDQFYKDFEAIQARRPDYRPGLTEHAIVTEIWFLLWNKLEGNDAATRDLFARFGPLPKRRANEVRKYRLARAYGWAGKPNAKTGKRSMAAFARFVAQQNKALPPGQRFGSGTDKWENLLRDLKRMLGQQKYRDEANAGFARRSQKGTTA